MEKIYDLEGSKIRIDLKDGLIRVYSDAELWLFLTATHGIRFELLVNTIKTSYLLEFGKVLNIANDSLIVEILVHIYCDYLGLGFNRIVKVIWIQKIVNKLLERAAVVDCGEKALDSNRWIWDSLAPLKMFFIKIFPKNLNASQLKKR